MNLNFIAISCVTSPRRGSLPYLWWVPLYTYVTRSKHCKQICFSCFTKNVMQLYNAVQNFVCGFIFVLFVSYSFMHACVYLSIFNMCLIYMNYWYRVNSYVSVLVFFFDAMTVPLWSLPFERHPPFGDPIFFWSTTGPHLAGMIQWKIPHRERWRESIGLAANPQWVKWRKFWMFFLFRFVLCLKQFCEVWV